MGRPVKTELHRSAFPNLALVYVYANVDGIHTDGGENIKKQVGSHRYKVTTNHGTAVCKLVASASPAQYQMYMLAGDSHGNDYFVTKLTRHRAVVQRKAGGSNYEFANGQSVKVSFGQGRVANVSVELNYD